MRIFTSLAEIPGDFGPTVVSIGNFDGVHLGHRLILEQVRKRAEARSARSVAVTFDPHPLRVLRPEKSPRLITPLPARLELLEATGMDAVLVLPFTVELSRVRADEFVKTIVHDALRAIEVHEGTNFRFGHRAEAGSPELIELGRRLGFDVVIHGACSIRGLTVSSSKIRELLSAGRIHTARALLGHAFFVLSGTAGGRGIGAAQAVPTINLAPYPELLPRNGVYVTRLRVEGQWFDAVTNVGNRPTFGQDSFAVESYILNFRPIRQSEDMPVHLAFLKRIREEKRWPSAEALKAQILRDAAYAQRYLRLMHRLAGQRTQGTPSR